MIKNYIFDFGNVLAEYIPDKLTAPYVEDEDERKLVSKVVFDRLYWDRLDEGTITDDEVKTEIRKRVPQNLVDVSCKVYDNWINTMAPVKNMEKLVFDIHQSGKRLYLVSNISKGFAETYANVKWIKDLLDCFDGLVFSGVVGKKKPNTDIFEYLLSEFDLKAEECLFVDDMERNIKGAKTLGIKGYLFDGDAEKLRNFVGL